MGKMDLTIEERQRRSELAVQLHSEGKFGGAAYGRMGGRPRLPRASERIAEKVASEADTIYDRLMDILVEGKNSDSLHAINQLLKIEENERQIIENEELRVEQLKRDELIELATNSLRELQEAGIIPHFVDSWAIELEDGAIEAIGSSGE